LHDATGFRLANAFVLNGCLTVILLWLVHWFSARFAGRKAAAVALFLMATLPLLGETATSAAMDLLNLTMLALAASTAALYLEVPGPDRLSLLVLSTILLAQSRYESLLYVVCSAGVIVLGWFRIRRVVLSWLAVLSPFLLVP